MTELKLWRKQANSLLADYRHVNKQVQEEEEKLSEAETRVSVVKEAQVVLQQVAQLVQQKAHERIATVVTRCLSAVFDESYVFHIHFERKRGKTEARMVFKQGELEVDPTSASGGGAVVLAAFALRLACVVMSQPTPRKLLIQDEPFHFVNGLEYQERVGGMLNALAEELGMQIVMATNRSWLRIGTVIEL